MRDRLDTPPSQAPPARRRRKSGLGWATLALIAGGGLVAVRTVVGPAAGRYRLERIDRGTIQSEVTAPGTVSAAMSPDLSRIEVRATVSEASPPARSRRCARATG
jgi:hypothetical protein